MNWISRKIIMAVFLSLCLLVFGTQSAISEESVTLVGQVNSELQFVTDNGAIFEIGEGEQGDLLTENIGINIEVKGTVQNDGETQILVVKEFRKI